MKGYPTTRQIVAAYTVEDTTMEVTMQLATNHPLGIVKVDSSKVGVLSSRWKTWAKQLNMYLAHQVRSISPNLIYLMNCWTCYKFIVFRMVSFVTVSFRGRVMLTRRLKESKNAIFASQSCIAVIINYLNNRVRLVIKNSILYVWWENQNLSVNFVFHSYNFIKISIFWYSSIDGSSRVTNLRVPFAVITFKISR